MSKGGTGYCRHCGKEVENECKCPERQNGNWVAKDSLRKRLCVILNGSEPVLDKLEALLKEVRANDFSDFLQSLTVKDNIGTVANKLSAKIAEIRKVTLCKK